MHRSIDHDLKPLPLNSNVLNCKTTEKKKTLKCLSPHRSLVLIAGSLYKLMILCVRAQACKHYTSIIVLSDGLYYLVEIILS